LTKHAFTTPSHNQAFLGEKYMNYLVQLYGLSPIMANRLKKTTKPAWYKFTCKYMNMTKI